MPEKSRKTVFVLGAGASHASDIPDPKLPLMKDFMVPLSDMRSDYPKLHRYLGKTYWKRKFSGINLEDVFTQLELDIDGYASIRSRPFEELVVVRRQLLDYVRRVLCGEGEQEAKPCSVHEALLRSCVQGGSPDTVITLNYDMVVDFTLLSMCKGAEWNPLQRMYSVLGGVPGDFMVAGLPALGPPRGGLLLKLHGAVDWTYCPNPMCKNHESFWASWLGLENKPVKAGEICTGCGTDFERVLVPPTMRKSFEQFPRLGLMWRLAYEELRRAHKVVFFGVSMAPSDYYLHWLIRSSFVRRKQKPEVIVINPCKEALQSTHRLTGTKPVHYRNIDEYSPEQTE